MNVSLTKKQEEYIAAMIAGGDYQNASELVRDALRMHQIYREKMFADLREEIRKGIEGPFIEASAEAIVAEEISTYTKRDRKTA